MTDTPQPRPRQFEMQIDIAAPRDAVFAALTNDTELSRWFAPENSIEPVEGGAVCWTWQGHFTWSQRIEILEPGARLRTRYDSAVDDGDGGKRPLFVDFLLEGEGGHTCLRLVHSGFDADAAFDEEFDGISQGWPVELRSLRLYLERHAGQDRQLAWSEVNIAAEPADAWARLLGPDGFACGPDITDRAEGDDFEVRTGDGDRFTGQVLQARGREFTGLARSHGDGFLRFWVGAHGGVTHVWLWLACYGQPAGTVEAIQERWDAMLARLFPVTVGSAEEGASVALVEVDVIDDPKRAQVMLQGQRLELLQELAEPASAAALARRLELPRQRVNYHLRELEAQALVELVEERRRGNVVERIYRRTGQSYVISTAALGPLGTDPDAIQDRFSSAYQIALASQAVRDLGVLQVGARQAGKKLPSFALEVDVRFANAGARAAFAEDLAAAVADLVRRYHDDAAPNGRRFHFYMGAYPRKKT